MDVTVILSRLAKVRKTTKGWTAKCPAHNDNSPSLMVSVRSDNSIGLHCFSGCQTQDVVAAIGLTLADLFADDRAEPGYVRPYRPPLTHADALRGLATESGLIASLAADILERKIPTEETFQRGALAASRIASALEFVEHGQ